MLVSGLTLLYSFKGKEVNISDNTPKKISIYYPASLRMYYCIEKYSDKYDIPKQYAYGIAKQETGFRNPFQLTYNARQISPTGALGPMQILLSTAKWIWNDNSITKDRLLEDIEFNVETSMKYLSMLHKKYGNWKTVFGYYNTGYPIVNEYANNVHKHNN